MSPSLKNITSFRAAFIFLLTLSCAAYFYQAAIARKDPGFSSEERGIFVQTLGEFARHLAENLEAQEQAGVDLAQRFESMSEGGSRRRLLESFLEEAPAVVRGVGLAGRSDGGRTTSFVTREPSARFDGMVVAPNRSIGELPISAREINMERRIHWQLLATPILSMPSRLSTIMFISTVNRDDEIFMVGELEWLRELLEKAGPQLLGYVFCITPAGDVIWSHDGHLHFEHDYIVVDASNKSALHKVRQFMSTSNRTGAPDFLKADAMGTGWYLLAVRGPSEAGPGRWGMLSILGVLFAAMTLLVEFLLSSFANQSLFHAGASGRSSEKKVAASDTRATKKALAERLFRLVSTYRLTDPEQTRIDSELQVARDIQFNLVPDKFPPYSEWREFDLYSLLSPAREIGGDFYDFFMPDPNRLVVTVGDVSGKGVPAALYMAVCRTAFRTLARTANGPGELLTNLNEMLVRDNQSGLYVTMACYFVNLASGRCEYALAGHPAPLLHRSAEGTTEFVDSPRETVIGIQAGINYPVGTTRFHPGDTLLLYSDGASEARNRNGEELEYDRLKEFYSQVVRATRCQDLIVDLEGMLRLFTAGGMQSDDITLVAFRYWGPGGQKIPRKKISAFQKAYSQRMTSHDI